MVLLNILQFSTDFSTSQYTHSSVHMCINDNDGELSTKAFWWL